MSKKIFGTKFQQKVWNYIKTIPKGQVKTYKQVAISVKNSKSARAVANACAKNPYAPKVPCHRVIRSDGRLGGYSGIGGIKKKLRLLRSEKVYIKDFLVIKMLKKSSKIKAN
jgi:methylated-DNA-[protein]-cysteine S-methyltransferase